MPGEKSGGWTSPATCEGADADAREIGSAVTRLLEDAELRASLGRNARQAHLERYHYERQFAPVLERIEAWVAEGREDG